MMNITRNLSCALALALISSACNPSPPTANAERDVANAPAAEPTATTGEGDVIDVGDLMAAPAKYVGQTVTVVADVEEVLGPNAFTLDEDAPLQGGVDNDMLVFSKKSGTLANIDDQWLNNKVRVTGMVGKWTVVEVEREIGWDLTPELETEVERTGAVLIASDIRRVEE